MKDLNTELDKLITMRGGEKHMWLRQHQELVIRFHQFAILFNCGILAKTPPPVKVPTTEI